jgi:hypothetical protein
MRTITDTVTISVMHGVISTEATANDQSVLCVHGGQIAKLLRMERPLVVGRGQTFQPILQQSQRSTEKQAETINE